MFTKAIKHNPNYALAYYNKGRCYQSMKNKSGAAKYYQMAIDINKLPDAFVLKVNHGCKQNIFYKNKSGLDWKHSLRLLKKYLKAKPSLKEYL